MKALNAVDFRILALNEMELMLPLLAEMNAHKTLEELSVLLADIHTQAYKCAAVFVDGKLAGICGMWHLTHFYSGKVLELENVIIAEEYRSLKLGKQLMDWVYTYAISIGCVGLELDTFTGNTRSHKFYYNEGFEIKGFHMLKKL
mgnify:FL=1